MKIYFSPEYSGHVYIDWSAHHELLWDSVVVDTAGLITLLELHLGIYHKGDTRPERIARYYNAMKQYLAEHPKSILAASFGINGLSVAKRCLSLRDELVMAGWPVAGCHPSERLDALAEIEQYFDSPGLGERLTALLARIGNSAICQQIEVVMPVEVEVLPPRIGALLTLMESRGGASRAAI